MLPELPEDKQYYYILDSDIYYIYNNRLHIVNMFNC